MTLPEVREPALALHRYLVNRAWHNDALIGPDSGIRINYRFGRFVKSYLRVLPWRDALYYLQAQGYWMLANWRLAGVLDDEAPRTLATACSQGVVSRQRPDGAWDYPNREWRGRLANVEGTWASIGLTESYRQTGDSRFLDAALRWHTFMEERLGFQPAAGGIAVHYFGDRQDAPVPNVSAFALHFLAELADATGDDRYLARASGMLAFLANVQRPSGEFPYEVPRTGETVRLAHFQCTQYNAFACLDILRYHQVTGDAEARPVIENLLRFLTAAVDEHGGIPYQCDRRPPQVTYHLAAVSAALHAGADYGIAGTRDAGVRARRSLLSRQRPDGSFPHSRQDYGFLSDQRVYPRNMAMILVHLLMLERDIAARPMAVSEHT